MIYKEKRLSEKRARIYASEVLLALEELHRRNIVFRDLKPDNVVLDGDGHAMLTDFGLSKEGVTGQSATKSFCGSAAYMAPEVLRRSGHGKAVDWYLLGAFIFEMLTGSPPYFVSDRERLFENIQTGKLVVPSYLSAEAKDLLVKLLTRDPKKRLGAGKEDAEEVKRHVWFKDMDWGLAMNRGLKPPRPVYRKIYPVPISIDKFYNGRREVNAIDNWSFVAN